MATGAADMADGLSIALRQPGPIALDVDIAVAPGKTLALVGSSGAGKTTVLRAIAGLYRPRRGRVVCNGTTWLDSDRAIDLPAQARRAGFVFQHYALFPHLTALGNVMEAMLHRPRAERPDAAGAMLARVHLEAYADRRPDALSGGQQQRVAIARALARDPDVLLLDEPFSAVDHPTRRALHLLLAEIRASSPVPIILVSHDLEDAARSADEICLLQHGRSVEIGPARALLDDPDSRIARWLSSAGDVAMPQ